MTIRAALFLDYDNVSLGFGDGGEAASKRFRDRPAAWLAALSDGTLAPPPGGDARRFLVLRCYADAAAMRRESREALLRAGFSLIDCPRLTAGAKNAADIRLVIDALDLLGIGERVEEFIVLSGDSDFTPLLERLRLEGRRSTVFAPPSISAIYRARADSVVAFDALAEAMGVPPPSPAPEPAPLVAQAPATVDLAKAAQLVGILRRLIAEAPEPLKMEAAAAKVNAEAPGAAPKWAGYGSFRKLVVAHAGPKLACDAHPLNVVRDPSRNYAAGSPAPAPAPARPCSDGPPHLIARIRKSAPNMPNFSPSIWSDVFLRLAEQPAGEPFDPRSLSASLRDEYRSRDMPVGRAGLYCVLSAIAISEPSAAERTPEALADLFRRNLSGFLAAKGAALDESEEAALAAWIGAPPPLRAAAE